MTIETYLAAWRDAGLVSTEQAAALSAIVRKDRFSVSLELNSLLYLGVLAFVAGLGWTVREHFANLGDTLVIVSLAALFGACLSYCFTREPQAFAFDYVLYLGCLTFAVALGYVEFRFHLLQEHWDAYLLASSCLYFALAYRFDNRFVLSLALSTLAGWFGIRLSAWNVFNGSIRTLMLVYGVLVGAIGGALYRADIKPHFIDAYLHVAVNAVLIGLTSGAVDGNAADVWPAVLVVASALSIVAGARCARFAFVVYGFVYGYVGVSAQVLRAGASDTAVMVYFLLSGVMVIAALVVMARRIGRA